MNEIRINHGIVITPVRASAVYPYSLEAVGKSFGGRTVLENVSFSLPKSGVFLVTGASGAGKTTLFRILAGLLPPDTGRLEGFRETRISYLFQEDRLLPWYTVRKNLLLTADAEAAERWLSLTGLTDAADLYPAELSGGMRRRAALARAMAHGGDLFLLDEPFNGVDAERKQAVLREILRAAQDALLLLATHEEDIISQLTKTE